MAFTDYSLTPSANTSIGDGIFIGPNMERGKVREALQQIAADGRALSDAVYSLTGVDVLYYATRAAGAAATVTDKVFSSDEEGSMAVYLRTATAPNYSKLYDVATQENIDALDPQIWEVGRVTPVAGSLASINWQREPTSPTIAVEALAGLWSDKVKWDTAIAGEFNSTNAPVTTPFSSPAAALLVAAQNTGSNATVCSLQTISGVQTSGKEASGVNFITYSGDGLTNVKMKGLEIDLQPAASTTILEAFGLALNAFTKEIPGNAIYIEGVFGGSWASGIRVSGLNSSIGAGIYGAGTMGTLVDSATGTYGQDAICLANTHKVRFRGTGSVHAKMYVDASNFWKFVMGDNNIAFREKTDTTTLVSIDPGGNVNLEAGGALEISGNAILTGQQTGYGTATGGSRISNFPGATATLLQTSQMLAQLILDLKAGKMPAA